MNGPPSLGILILARSSNIAQRWTQALDDGQTQTWLSLADMPGQARLDLVLTDGSLHDLPPDLAALMSVLPDWPVGQDRCGESLDGTAPERRGESPERATPTTAGLPCPAPAAPSHVLRQPESAGEPGYPSAGPSAFASPHIDLSDRPGVIAVGMPTTELGAQADVSLPADATPRELRLACGLLGQIVRLRRALAVHADSERRLAREALTDPLTGLPNRRAWDQRLGERLVPLPCPAPPFCLAVLDLDRFKPVNDSEGHAVGDRVLQTVGRTLGQNLRHGDFVARLGGDEFGLLLPVSDQATAQHVVDRVRRALPAALASAGLPAVTASAGLCFHGPDAVAAPLPCPTDLVAAADAALRQAKTSGRDRAVATTAT